MNIHTKKRRIKFFAEGMLLLATLIWGGTFVTVKSALNEASAFLFVAIRFSIATVLLIPLIFKHFKLFNQKSVKEGAVLGILLFSGFIFQTLGLTITSATKSAFITALFVIFTPVFQTIIEKRVPSKPILLSIFLVFIGIAFLSSKENSFLDIFTEIGSNFNLGDFLTLLCAISYGIYMVYLDIVSKNTDYRIITFIQISTTALLSISFTFIFAILKIETVVFNFKPIVIYALLYTSVLATVVNLLLQTKYQKEVTPAKAGIIFSFEPIFAALFAFIILSEKISIFGIFGSVFIFCGLLISELWKEE